jgi:hypothetical protein
MNADNCQENEICVIALESQIRAFAMQQYVVRLGFCSLNKTKISTGN